MIYEDSVKKMDNLSPRYIILATILQNKWTIYTKYE